MKLIAAALALTLALPACAVETTIPDSGTVGSNPGAARVDKGENHDRDAFGHALALVEVLSGIAAHAENPDQAFDEVLAGRSPKANRAASGLLEEVTADMPREYRERVGAIGENLLTAARRQSSAGTPGTAADALQARKDLTAMGLRYYDPKDFLDAVKRDDALAVELFIAGRGVNLEARDPEGRTALEIARSRGNAPLAQRLAKSLPPTR